MSQLMLVNPKKRRKTRKTRKAKSRRTGIAKYAHNPIRKKLRRYRRNPIGRKTGMVATFTGGAIGAAGALAVDVAMQKLPIPDNLKTGQLAPIVKGMVGIGLGMVVSKVLKKNELGKQLANGAVTVALYSAGRQMIGPSIGLAGSDEGLLGYDSGLLGYSMFDEQGDDLGWYEPAPTSAWDNDDELNGFSEF